jgi:DNA-binding NtrC family response regulator
MRREPPPGAALTLLFQAGKPCEVAPFDLSGAAAVTFGRSVREHGGRWVDAGQERRLVLEVDDPRMSGVHAHLRRLPAGWALEDADSKNGTQVNGRGIKQVTLRDGDLVEVGRSFFVFRDEPPSPPVARSGDQPPGFATANPAAARELQRLAVIAHSQVPVLLVGESGTGKELMARAVHQMSGRRGPFQAVNCGALAWSLLESELFGYRKGAFSDARADRLGLIRAADGGTLFLDEIGDLALEAQVAFLRVLQEGEVQPLGADRPVPVDVRVVSATHRNLQTMAKTERFRSDLLARLNGFTMQIPPLRERREDLGSLVLALVRRHRPGQAGQVELTPAVIRAFHAYDWPLNIRELEKTIVTALVLAEGKTLDLEHLASPAIANAVESDETDATLVSGQATQRDHLSALLTQFRGNVSSVADELRTSRAQVHRLCKRFGIDLSEYRDQA